MTTEEKIFEAAFRVFQLKGFKVARMQEIADEASLRLYVDKMGLDRIDRRVLECIIEKYDGGPVGIDTIAAAISEERDTIEDVYEPYLMQLGFLGRTPRGRVATKLAYEHLGISQTGK